MKNNIIMKSDTMNYNDFIYNELVDIADRVGFAIPMGYDHIRLARELGAYLDIKDKHPLLRDCKLMKMEKGWKKRGGEIC